MRSTLLLPILAAALLAGCGGGSSGEENSMAASGSSSNTSIEAVRIADYLYEPGDVVVPVGTKVTFTNEDSAPHTATSKQQGAFESGSIGKGETGSITLEQTGTYEYYCAFHPFMKGTITAE